MKMEKEKIMAEYKPPLNGSTGDVYPEITTRVISWLMEY
jgi:hypothetical protein